MKTEKVDEKKTLAYAVAFHFCSSDKIVFRIDNNIYQHIGTIYDGTKDDRNPNILEVVYNQGYEI